MPWHFISMEGLRNGGVDWSGEGGTQKEIGEELGRDEEVKTMVWK